MDQWLRVLTAFYEDLSLVPGTYAGQLATAGTPALEGL